MSKKKAEFSPDKNYKWDPQDSFTITGQQFASFYHALNQEIHTPGGAPIAAKFEAYSVMMDIFKQYVESGVITETDSMSEEMVQDNEVHQLFQK